MSGGIRSRKGQEMMMVVRARAERRKLISTRPGVNAHHHRHQGIAGEGGVTMVGGDMLASPRQADR